MSIANIASFRKSMQLVFPQTLMQHESWLILQTRACRQNRRPIMRARGIGAECRLFATFIDLVLGMHNRKPAAFLPEPVGMEKLTGYNPNHLKIQYDISNPHDFFDKEPRRWQLLSKIAPLSRVAAIIDKMQSAPRPRKAPVVRKCKIR